MAIEINKNGFEQAHSFLSDIVFKLKSDKKSESDLQKLKLLQARHNNPEFEMEIAELICGAIIVFHIEVHFSNKIFQGFGYAIYS